MCRNPLLRSVLAAALVLALLLPAVAAARGPVPNAAPHSVWAMPSGSLWDLFLRFLGKTPHLKNGWTIDPDGVAGAPNPATDNRGTIDPDGLKNGSQIDPNGARVTSVPPQTDNRSQIDPNG